MRKIIIFFVIVFLSSCSFFGKEKIENKSKEINVEVEKNVNLKNSNRGKLIKEYINIKEECNKVIEGEESEYLGNTDILNSYKNSLDFFLDKEKTNFYKNFFNGIKNGGLEFLREKLEKIPKNKLGYIAINDILNNKNNCKGSYDVKKCLELKKFINISLGKENIKEVEDISEYKLIFFLNNFNIDKSKKYLNSLFLKHCYNIKKGD